MKKNPLKKIRMLPLGMAASFLISLAGCSNNNGNSKNTLKDYAIESIEETSEYCLVRIDGHIYLTTREKKLMKDGRRRIDAYRDVKSGDLVGFTLEPTWERNAIEELEEELENADYNDYNEIKSWTTHDNSTRDFEVFGGIYGYGNILPAASIYELTDFMTQTKMLEEDLAFFTSDSDRLKDYIDAKMKFDYQPATSATFDLIKRSTVVTSLDELVLHIDEYHEEGHKLIKFTCIKGDTQEVVVGYRASESEKDIGYNIVYDVITGNLINISLTNANGYDEIIEEELLGTAYTIEDLKNLEPAKEPELDVNENQGTTEEQKETDMASDGQIEGATEDWLKDESHPTYPNLYEVNFDAMLKQEFEIKDEILNNDDVQKVISEIKDYFGETPLYIQGGQVSSTEAGIKTSLYVVDNENVIEALYIRYNFLHLHIIYRFDDPIYSKSTVSYYLQFDEDGTTVVNETTTKYTDSNQAVYTKEIRDEYIYKYEEYEYDYEYQSISFNEPDAPLTIMIKRNKYNSKKLVIATAEGENTILLSQSRYDKLKEAMDKYFSEGNLLGFVKDNKDILKQLVRSNEDEYSDEQIDYIDLLIDMYSDMEPSKRLNLQ